MCRLGSIAPLILLVAACAPTPVAPPVVSAPKFPEFVAPSVPPSFVGGPLAAAYERGWRFLQAGNLRVAELEFRTAAKASPAFFPAETALGYLALARQDAGAALPHFDRVLAQHPREVSVLVGRGQALVALDREADALAAFEAALAVDPSLAEVARRTAVLRFRAQQEALRRARIATQAGDLDEAAAWYDRAIAGSPESAFLYRELGLVERRQGADRRALDHFRRAAALDPDDARSLVEIGDILEAQGDNEAAIQTFSDALAADPSDEVRARLDRARARAELARLPEQYRAIGDAPHVTRAGLAALIGVRLAPLLDTMRRPDPVVITDIRDHWAAVWIMAVAGAGVMEPFANYAFQPEGDVPRADFALVVSRLLARLTDLSPTLQNRWPADRATFADLPEGHLAHAAASLAVAAGVLPTGPDGRFHPLQPVSGKEALVAIDRLESIADPVVGKRGAR